MSINWKAWLGCYVLAVGIGVAVAMLVSLLIPSTLVVAATAFCASAIAMLVLINITGAVKP